VGVCQEPDQVVARAKVGDDGVGFRQFCATPGDDRGVRVRSGAVKLGVTAAARVGARAAMGADCRLWVTREQEDER